MALTRKHFEMVARNIKHASERARYPEQVRLLNDLACDLAFDFRADNPRFDRERFLRACGF